MIPFFIDKFEYNYQSNQQLITAIEKTPASYTERVQRLLGHTLNAQNIWNHRILGVAPTQLVWDTFGIERLSLLNEENHEQSLEIVQKFALEDSIEYTTSTGEVFKNTTAEILFHIINHSTYHRGQLMTALKQNRIVPISTDYIFHNRS